MRNAWRAPQFVAVVRLSSCESQLLLYAFVDYAGWSCSARCMQNLGFYYITVATWCSDFWNFLKYLPGLPSVFLWGSYRHYIKLIAHSSGVTVDMTPCAGELKNFWWSCSLLKKPFFFFLYKEFLIPFGPVKRAWLLAAGSEHKVCRTERVSIRTRAPSLLASPGVPVKGHWF